jgi:hypothetical protein
LKNKEACGSNPSLVLNMVGFVYNSKMFACECLKVLSIDENILCVGMRSQIPQKILDCFTSIKICKTIQFYKKITKFTKFNGSYFLGLLKKEILHSMILNFDKKNNSSKCNGI